MIGHRKSKEQTVRELRREGKTVSQISAELKISPATVNRYLNPELREAQSGTKRKSSVPEGIFDEHAHENWIAGGFRYELNEE